MKIAVFGQFKPRWYGCMSEWTADGFEMNGHEVERVDRKEVILFPEQFDLIMHVDCSEDYSDHVTKCKGGVRAFWSLDSHMPEGKERSVNIARKCDIVFSSNYEAGVKILEKFGIQSYLMPITYNDRLVSMGYDPDKATRETKYDVVMIGHENSSERTKLWKILNDNYKSFTGKATETEYCDVMSDAKIIVNQPTEPWDMILNNRFFEAMAFGKTLLQKELTTSLIEKLGFRNKDHFLYWHDFDDLKKKIDELFSDKTHSYEIGMKFRDKNLIEQYSMSAQCAKIESIILSKFYDKL